MEFANLPQRDGKINPEQPLNIAYFSTEEVDYFVHKLQARQLKLEQQNQALRLWAETLNNAFLALTSHTSHKAILNEILKQVQQLVPYCAANIMLLQNDILHMVCWQGYESYGGEALPATLERSLAQFPLEARVVQSQQNLIIPDTRYEPDWVDLKGLSWIRSSVIIPICLHEKVLGLLKLDSDVPNKFLLKDVEWLTPLANAAALALKKTLLNDQTQHELARRVVQAETEIIQLNQKLLTLQYAGTTITSDSNLQYVLNTVTREMAKLLKVEGCAIFKWDEITNTILLISKYGLEGCWEEGLLVEAYLVTELPLIQHVLVECRPQQITGSHPDIYPAESAYMQKANLKTLLTVPMEFRARTVGLVKIMDAQEERTFTNREIGLIQLLGNQVASAIENARLYEQVQQQLVEMMEIEKDLRRIATKQHAVLNAIPDSIFYLDRNGKLLNYKIVDNHIPLGILEAQIVGEGFDNTSPTNLIDLIRHYLDQKPLSNTTQSFEFQLLLPEEVQNFEIRLVPSGHNEVLAMVRNITKQKQMAEALIQERNLLRTLIDNLPDYIFVKDTEGRYVINNKAHCQILKATSPNEITGKSSADFFPPDVAAQHYAEDQLVLESGQPIINKETAFIDSAGCKRWRVTTKVPLWDAHGKIVGLVSIGRDITKQKQAEKTLQESKAK